MSLLNPIVNILPDLNKAFLETIYMVGVSLAVALLIGLPLGVLLFTTTKNLFFENSIVNRSLGVAVNIVRSIPFIILLVALLPLTDLLTGSTIGPRAASVSLSVSAIPFFARIVETALRENINDHFAYRLLSNGRDNRRWRNWRPGHPVRILPI